MPYGVARPNRYGIDVAVTSAALVFSSTTMKTWLNCEVPGGGACVTVMVALPLLPSEVAVIVAEPTATPVTRPLASTLATVGVPLAHVTTRPESGAPVASCGVAVSCSVPPTETDPVAGLTTTDDTGMFTTVIVAVPLLFSLVAVIVAPPTATAVTRPFASTVAMVWPLVAQVTVR